VILTALFDSIHCAAWATELPSRIEKVLWVITSVLSTMSFTNIVMNALTTAILHVKASSLMRHLKPGARKRTIRTKMDCRPRIEIFPKDGQVWIKGMYFECEDSKIFSVTG
jgi:hypothetical protein